MSFLLDPPIEQSPVKSDLSRLRVALVHYWLVGMRGGEKVLEELCRLFPQADIFTLVVDRDSLSPTLRRHRIVPSFLQRIGGRRHYQRMLPLMPFALESFDLSGYDLIISSEAGPAKGIIPPPDALHICYCHSPMRYIWDLYPQYRAQSGAATRMMMSAVAPLLRQWDVTTAARVDHFVANSAFVAKRIEKYYRRTATVIHPPVDVERRRIDTSPGDFYLCAGQVTPYKRVDLAVEAFTRMGKPLLIVGNGITRDLRNRAGPTIRFVDKVTDEELDGYFRTCRALVYPGLEDFGMIPVEVMASGRPVIAYGRGGAAETVIPGKTGVLFEEQTVEALNDAIGLFEIEQNKLDPLYIKSHSNQFSPGKFKSKMENIIYNLCSNI